MRIKTYNAYLYGGEIDIKLLHMCPNCGQITSWKIWSISPTWTELAQTARLENSKCHICGKKIMTREDYAVWDVDKKTSTAALKTKLYEKIAQIEGEKYRQEIEKMKSKSKKYPDMSTDNDIAQNVKKDTGLLKAYIKQLIDLEIWAQLLEEHIVFLNEKNVDVTREKVHKKSQNSNDAKGQAKQKERELLGEISQLKKEFKETDWSKNVKSNKITAPSVPEYYSEADPVKPIKPVMKQPRFFNKTKVLAENERLENEYNQAMEKYEQDIKKAEEAKKQNAVMRAQYEKEMNEYNATAKQAKKVFDQEVAEAKARGKEELDRKIEEINKKIEEVNNPSGDNDDETAVEAILKSERNEYVKLLKSLWEAENRLFSINIIYPNYRDVFALSSFYEYFSSERCYGLEGPDGAYNLYESERRSDVAATFYRKLEDINKNQVILYREANDMLKNLNSLNKKLTEAVKNASEEESTEVEITPELAEKLFEKYLEQNNGVEEMITKAIEEANAYGK